VGGGGFGVEFVRGGGAPRRGRWGYGEREGGGWGGAAAPAAIGPWGPGGVGGGRGGVGRRGGGGDGPGEDRARARALHLPSAGGLVSQPGRVRWPTRSPPLIFCPTRPHGPRPTTSAPPTKTKQEPHPRQRRRPPHPACVGWSGGEGASASSVCLRNRECVRNNRADSHPVGCYNHEQRTNPTNTQLRPPTEEPTPPRGGGEGGGGG